MISIGGPSSNLPPASDIENRSNHSCPFQASLAQVRLPSLPQNRKAESRAHSRLTRSVPRYCHGPAERRCVTSARLTPYPPSSLIIPRRSRRPSSRLCFRWIDNFCRYGKFDSGVFDGAPSNDLLRPKISLGEMMSYLPIAGGHITMAERYVSKGFSFVLGWNYWYNWTIVLPAELRFVRA